MGSFQIVYDDFSGGQYMGVRDANQPKNTWNGNNVIATPNGELIPTGTITVGTYAGVAGQTNVGIYGHWFDYVNAYIFSRYGSTTYMHKYAHQNGTLYPITPTTYTLSGAINTNVAYSFLSASFFYGAGTTIYEAIASSGTQGPNMSFVSGYLPLFIESYKLRLVVASINSQRLHYSGVWGGSGYGAFAAGQYYDFNSSIRAIYPRTDDLLVVCDDGVYSLTGVLGSSVNIQLLAPQHNATNGMDRGAVINRNLYYIDNPGTVSGTDSNGSFDGRLYRFIGATNQHAASFKYGDYIFSDTGKRPAMAGSVVGLTNARLSVQFRNGITYFETTPGVYGKAQVWNITPSNNALAYDKVYQIAKCMDEAPDEYFLTAFVNHDATNKPIVIYRTIINVPGPTKLDANFSISSSSPIQNPSGTVELSEYWHQKPFTVKEVFIEYIATTGAAVSCYIEPTGVVDVPPANITASTTSSDTSPAVGNTRMYRYWPNNAMKGFGVKPHLTITNSFIKRVILNCED
jgi:hypothetical protein